MIRDPKRAASLLLAGLTVLGAGQAHGQASLDSGGLDIVVRFHGYTPNDPAHPLVGVEELLLESAWDRQRLRATSVDTDPPFLNELTLHSDAGTPLEDRGCMTVQALDPETDLPGVVYELEAGTRFGGMRGTYNWPDLLTPPVSPFADPVADGCEEDAATVPILLEDCPGVVRFTVVEAAPFFDNDPHVVVPFPVARIETRSVDDSLHPGWGPVLLHADWQAGVFRSGVASVHHPSRGGMDTRVEFEVQSGSDYTLDTFVHRGVAIADGPTAAHADDGLHAVVPCNEIRDFYLPLHEGGSGEGSGCSLSGGLDVRGEVENCYRWRGFDVEVLQGPGGHARGAKVGSQDPADEPCDTATHPDWVLRNLYCGPYETIRATTWLRDYSVELDWPTFGPVLPAPPALGPGNDLGDLFVSDPGLIRGRVRFRTDEPALDGLRHVRLAELADLEEDSAWGTAIQHVDGITGDGRSRTPIVRAPAFDAGTGAFEAGYETVVTGLHGADWPWRLLDVQLAMASHPGVTDTAGIDPADWLSCGGVLFHPASPSDTVSMGGAALERDLDYCFGRLTVLFESNVPFQAPQLLPRLPGRGPQPAPPQDYRASFQMSGIPLASEATHVRSSRVTGYLPQGQGYSFRASVRTESGTRSELPMACDVDIGCGQDVVLDGPLTLLVDAPTCTGPGSAEVLVDAEAFHCTGAGAELVSELSWENLTTGDSEVVCRGDCAGSHAFVVAPLAPCANAIRVVALDDSDPPLRSTVSFTVRADEDPPEVAGGCPDRLSSGPIVTGLEWIDGCGGPLLQTCDPPIGTELEPGEHAVTCEASDGCNTASCSFLVDVTENSAPSCEAGVDATAGCEGAPLAGSAWDAEDDELEIRWSSSCADAEFEPGPDVLDPVVRLDAGCFAECELTLEVSDGLLTCSDSLRVTFADEEGPVFVEQPGLGDGGPVFLWPPNHGYVDISLADTGAVVEDGCGGEVELRFSDCRSSQPEEALGDGRSPRDCVVSPDGSRLSLRAERSGDCSPLGRSYTAHLVAIDACGNETRSAPFHACVPHDAPRRGRDFVLSAASTSNQPDRREGANGSYGEGCGEGCSLAD